MFDCAALTEPVYSSINPQTGAGLPTRSATEAKNASKDGYTDFRGTVLHASAYRTKSQVDVHRLYQSSDFSYEAATDRIATLRAGYADQGISAYAARENSWCSQAVWAPERGSIHRSSVGKSPPASLSSTGWKNGPVAFQVAASPVNHGPPTNVPEPVISDRSTNDKKFTFAVIPDTQPEV
ncbi:MAG: hypothetical protein QM619_06375 [Micropruina sp.]|uniref:hypothetical protein n=1 Tax=Micropruina sp. TaxID=2737536 RepID=UPI0039E53B8F